MVRKRVTSRPALNTQRATIEDVPEPETPEPASDVQAPPGTGHRTIPGGISSVSIDNTSPSRSRDTQEVAIDLHRIRYGGRNRIGSLFE
jgi:hypothetical protein